ncbi:hypothetical protein [Cellulomonas sp.]|uniref:hypothetical protein n=1 Tax=Cellulomonas sp. TaxID=40001 RepID=UPI0028114C2A|nr:hypothetical protein [Cellulomonas sp.]
MSFDLAFWRQDPPPSPDAAFHIYDRLTEGETGVVGADLAVERFRAAVLESFGDLDDETADSSPWASPVYATDECVILTISGSRSAELAPRLTRMASEHGLVVYDPQNDTVVG